MLNVKPLPEAVVGSKEPERGIGTTTGQMKAAKIGALFIVGDRGMVSYATSLARSIGRDDIIVEHVASAMVGHGSKFMGSRYPQIVVDHACPFSDSAWLLVEDANKRARRKPTATKPTVKAKPAPGVTLSRKHTKELVAAIKVAIGYYGEAGGKWCADLAALLAIVEKHANK